MIDWKGPWPAAPLRDRVLMLCGEYANGLYRRDIVQKLRVPGLVVNRVLDRLVTDGWLAVEHPYGEPDKNSNFTVVEDRAGFTELRDLWFIEYNYVPDAAPVFDRRPKPEGSGEWVQLIEDAVAHTPAGTPHIPEHVYRGLLLRVKRQLWRSTEIEARMQEMYPEMKWDNERARDIVHLPTHHNVSLPPSDPGDTPGEVLVSTLMLAAKCREAAREDAWKFTYLQSSSDAASARVRAMSTITRYRGNVLGAFAIPRPATRDDVLRAGVTMANAAAFLEGRQQYASMDSFGFAGDAMIAYTYRDIARKLEEIAGEIIAMPEVSPAASCAQGQEALGAAPDLAPPARGWWDSVVEHVHTDVRDPETLGAPVHVEGPSELRGGDQIVGIGEDDLSIPVEVLEGPDVEGMVVLAIAGEFTSSKVGSERLEHHGGLRVRRSARETE